MRLLYLVLDNAGANEEELKQKTILGQAAMLPGDTFFARAIPMGPQYYHESAVGLALCVPGILEAVRRWETEFDAALVGCFVDPGVRAARTVAQIPIIGVGQASMALVQTVADRFGIITIMPTNVPDIEHLMAGLQVSHKCVGVDSIGLPANAVYEDPETAAGRIEVAARRMLRLGAQAILLGCLSFGFNPLAPELRKRLGVPVVDPLMAGIIVARAHVLLGLHPSPLAHPANDQPDELDRYLDRLVEQQQV